jgi:acyl carrier protein
MSVKDQIRKFITENFYLPDPAALADDASLLDQGIIDSTGVLEIIGFLEDAFRISIEDSEMVPENLDSIERITSFVTGKCEADDASAPISLPADSVAP